MGGHEPPCSCPELSPGPLQEQQVLTTSNLSTAQEVLCLGRR